MDKEKEIRKGLVSTIIPVFNRASMLFEAVESVLSQTYGDIEVIIVDDGSTDGTAEEAKKLVLGNPAKVRLVRKENSGPGSSREAGRKIAEGEYIQYLDSDDLLMPEKFRRQVAGLERNPDCGVSYGITHYHRLGQEKNAKVFKKTGLRFETIFPLFLIERAWGTSTPLYRREIANAIGPWSNAWAEEDWEYDCRIGALATRLHYCDELVSVQRGLPGARLSQGGRDCTRTLRSQAECREKILHSALRADVARDSEEMKNFGRQLFALARDCAAAGLVDEAKQVIGLTRRGAYSGGSAAMEYILYSGISGLIGWKAMGRLSRVIEKRKTLLSTE